MISHGRNIAQDLIKFKYDVLPSERRTVQKSGISMFGIYYNSEVLRKWILSKEPGDRRKSRNFIVRYDPRDIREIYFYDPDDQAYFTIMSNKPLMNRLFQDTPLSLWEFRSVNNQITAQGLREVKTKEKMQIIAILQDMQEITSSKKKSERLQKARRKRRVEQKKKRKEM